MLGIGYRKANPTDYILHFSNRRNFAIEQERRLKENELQTERSSRLSSGNCTSMSSEPKSLSKSNVPP